MRYRVHTLGGEPYRDPEGSMIIVEARGGREDTAVMVIVSAYATCAEQVLFANKVVDLLNAADLV